MLNWIANIFVTEPFGDVVATALSAEQGQIMFYIAANRGPWLETTSPRHYRPNQEGINYPTPFRSHPMMVYPRLSCSQVQCILHYSLSITTI